MTSVPNRRETGPKPRVLLRRVTSRETHAACLTVLGHPTDARRRGDTELSITEIGYVCGFADSAHFSRSFKKRFGEPPSAWRAPP